MDSIHPIEAPKTNLLTNLKEKFRNKPREFWLLWGGIGGLIGLMIILTIFFTLKNISNSVSPVLSPTPNVTPKPSKTPTPTKRVSSTPIPTLKPSLSPTATPSLTPTSTPQPTSTPVPPTATPVPDTSPPTITSMTGPEDGTTISSNSFCFPMSISDNKSTNPDILTQHTFDGTPWTNWEANYSPCFSNVSDGSHTFSVRAKDEAGNTSATITRTFTVQQ